MLTSSRTVLVAVVAIFRNVVIVNTVVWKKTRLQRAIDDTPKLNVLQLIARGGNMDARDFEMEMLKENLNVVQKRNDMKSLHLGRLVGLAEFIEQNPTNEYLTAAFLKKQISDIVKEYKEASCKR